VPPSADADDFETGNMRWVLVSGAIKRRGIWPDLASAASTRSSPFFASWNDEVWDLWLSHAIIPLEPGELHVSSTRHGPVQLATPPWAEAAVFAETTAMAEGWDKLAEINLPVGFVMGGDPQATTGEENERIVDAGHLVSAATSASMSGSTRTSLGTSMGMVSSRTTVVGASGVVECVADSVISGRARETRRARRRALAFHRQCRL
jgi:hypothetical protein